MERPMKEKVKLIGAGLTGLLTAYRLQELGYGVTVLEARDRIGGRIHTKHENDTTLEMGATWFNDTHLNLKRIIQEFKVPYFEQFLQGTSFFQTFSNVPPQAITVPNDSPSYRFKLGTDSLLSAIASKLMPNTIRLGTRVTALNFNESKVQLTTATNSLEADRVISTVPPALAIHDIQFKPSLAAEVVTVMKNTHTWMQDSIKIGLAYKTPFWRSKGFSGTIFSNVGPLTEFYDQSNLERNSYGLVGFASGSCAQLTKQQRIEKIELQLKTVFGEEALDYIAYHETLWFNERDTKSNQQTDAVFPHQNGGHPVYQRLFYGGRLLISGAETSQYHPGYMEGAIWAAEAAVEKLQNSTR